MRCRLATLMTSCLVGTLLAAQDRPNLTGVWTLDPARSESIANGAQPPTRLTILHDTLELTIEADLGSRRHVLKYAFEPRAAPKADEARIGKWSWDGTRVITDRMTEVQEKTVTARQAYSLAASGTELIVETTVEVQHGYTLRGTKNYATATDVYTRD